MRGKKLSIIENMAWNTAGSFVYLFCQWLLTVIVVRLSGDIADAGKFSLAISITNIFYNLACFNVRPYLVSDLSKKYSGNEYSAFRIITCALSVLSCFIYAGFFRYSKEQVSCVVLYMVFKLGEAWVDLLHGFEQKNSRMDIGGISLLIRGILAVGGFSAGLYFTQNVSYSIIAMTVLTWAFIIVFDCPNAFRFEDYIPKFNGPVIKKMTIEFLPLTLGALARSLGANLPRQFLENQMGSEALGIYSTVATPAVIVQVAASYIFNPILTEFAEKYHSDKGNGFEKLVGKISGVLIVLSGVCILGAKVLGEWGLNLLYGDRIACYAYLFLPVIYYTCLNAFVWFLWNLLVVMRKLKSLLITNVVTTAICIPLMKQIIAHWGMDGVSYGLIIYSIALIAVMICVVLIDLCSKKKRNEKI